MFVADDLVPIAKSDAGQTNIAFRIDDPIAFIGEIRDAATDGSVEFGVRSLDEEPRVLSHAEEAFDGRLQVFGRVVSVLNVADDVDHELRLPEIPTAAVLEEIDHGFQRCLYL